VPIDPGQPWPREIPLPAVLKPRDGAGSQAVQLLHEPSPHPPSIEGPSRLERFCPGLAASVAAMAGPAGHTLLPPCTQRLTQDGRFCYLGGSLLAHPSLAARAHRLAARALACLPEPRGYIGFDLVLGEQPANDVIIEINPRPTTSYVGLRHAVAENLAAVLLAALRSAPMEVRLRARAVSFTAAGEVYHL
jgi:predicted ATP-grasp superfamily ATP-dependent carboligase